MSTRKHMQEVLKSPSLVAALARYRRNFAGHGQVTRKLSGGAHVTSERETEKAGNLDMSGLEKLDVPQPLYTVPDRYKERRPCTCKSHEGNRWCKVSEFSERTRNGKRYPNSWCKKCCARYAYEQYHSLDKHAP